MNSHSHTGKAYKIQYNSQKSCKIFVVCVETVENITRFVLPCVDVRVFYDFQLNTHQPKKKWN